MEFASNTIGGVTINGTVAREEIFGSSEAILFMVVVVTIKYLVVLAMIRFLARILQLSLQVRIG